MQFRWLCFALIAARGAGVAAASELSAVPVLSGGGIERGIAFLRCTTGSDGVFWFSRGAILDVGVTTDVLLATAHGLPPDAETVKRDCRVIVRGRPRAILQVWHAGGDRAGPTHDWSVILTQRITGDVHRWRVGLPTSDWLINAVAQGAPVSLVLRSPDSPQNNCRLEPETEDPGALFAHSCVTYPGLSGSPIVIGLAVEPQPVLIAVHIGSQSRWTGSKLDFVSVARPVDAEIAATIEAAAAYSIDARGRAAARRADPRH
jgi:hypothetical protein